MNQSLSVFNSDQINSQGYVMPVETLASALEQGWLLGTPMNRSHDRHRLDGWSRPLGLHLEPGLARLTGLCFWPETEDEAEGLEQSLFAHLGRQITKQVRPSVAELKALLKERLKGDEEPILVESAALKSQGLAERVFPDIFEQQDKDGLISLGMLDAIAPGVYQRDGLLLFATPYLRRSLSRLNTLNGALLSKLHALTDNPELSVKVRLDADVIGLESTYQRSLEFAHWWGPHFNDDLKSIPDGVAQHKADDRQKFFSGVLHTDFWWHQQNDLKTLECEEVLDIPSLGVSNDRYGCRYVHSIIDANSDLPIHLDGAIRMYDDDKMIERLDVNLMHAGKKTEYTKQWRVDGPIPIPQWKELITHNFRDNELVGEYLGGVDESDHDWPCIVNSQPEPIHAFVPCNMSPGDGVRVSIAYNLPDESEVGDTPVELIPRDTFGTADKRQYYIEADTLEVVKLLRRQGVAVAIPDNVVRLAFEDTVINISLILHRGSSAVGLATQTMGVLKTLCAAWVERKDDRNVSFVIGVQYEDRIIYFSFAGHVVDLHLFLTDFGTAIPDCPTSIGAWAAQIRDFLTDQFQAAENQPQLGRMMRKTGILQFSRNMIDPSCYQPFQTEEGSLGFDFALPRTESELIDMWISGELTYGMTWILKQSTCSVCDSEYFECNCCKYVDRHVAQNMTDAEILELFWTNRPASPREHHIFDPEREQ